MTRIYDILKTPFMEAWKQANPSKWSKFTQTTSNQYMINAMRHSQLFNEVVDNWLFIGTTDIISPEVYKLFRDEFIDRFFTRNIKFQTVEIFIMRLNATVNANVDLITLSYSPQSKKEFVYGKTTSTSTSTGTSATSSKTVDVDLPQTLESWDGDLKYASSANQNKGNSQDNNVTTNEAYSAPDFKTLHEIANLKEQLFKELDKKLFSQIY